jgi:hypothetical protein
MPTTERRGRDIPLRPKSPLHLSSGSDLPSVTSAVAALLSAFSDIYPSVKKAIEDRLMDLPKATLESCQPLENYVSRPLLEKKIGNVYNSSLKFGSEWFSIVAGAKGAGKSTEIEQVLKDKPGVLFLKVSQADTESSILSKLLNVGKGSIGETWNLELESLAPFFWDAADKLKGRRITVVLEVERGTASDEVLYMIKSSAKKLARFANVMVILSEANAALMFGDDPRHEFIWVEEMTPDEATTCAKLEFPEIDDGDLKEFIEKVGIIDHRY